jgi:hypothetical protein
MNIGEIKQHFALELLSELEGVIPEEFLGVNIHQNKEGDRLLVTYWDGNAQALPLVPTRDEIKRAAARTVKKWIMEQVGNNYGKRLSKFVRHYGLN